MESRLLTWHERDEWLQRLLELPPDRRDVYYTPGYCCAAALHAPPEAVCAWSFRAGDRHALYPFLKLPLAPLELLPAADGHYDIQGFYGYNGVLSNSDDPAFAADFAVAFHEFCRRERIAVEFTRFHPVLNNVTFSRGPLEVVELQETVIVDLAPDPTARWASSYDARNRNMIRKALKNGVTAAPGHDWTGFAALYRNTMDRCQATGEYYFPDRYFDRLRSLAPPEGECRLFEAHYQGRAIAALLLLLHGPYAHYHLSARDPEHARLAAGNLLLDFAIDEARRAGARLLHLGGGRHADDSLLRFKAGFSPRRGRFAIGFRAHDPDLYARLCAAWSQRYPELASANGRYFQRYRLQPSSPSQEE